MDWAASTLHSGQVPMDVSRTLIEFNLSVSSFIFELGEPFLPALFIGGKEKGPNLIPIIWMEHSFACEWPAQVTLNGVLLGLEPYSEGLTPSY